MAKRTGKDADLKRYKSISNKVRKLTHRDHREYQEAITLNLHDDQKPCWRWLKKTRQTVSGIQNLVYHNSVVTSTIEKAKVLNQYFCTVFTKEDLTNLEKLREEGSVNEASETLEDIRVTEEDVLYVLRRIDATKASGPDNLPGRLLKEGAQHLAQPLSHLFNMSIQSGLLPRDWKNANVTPVYKKGSRHNLSNYLPVSLTSVVFKVFERIIHRNIVNFLYDTDQLHDYQHGFRAKHSSQMQLLSTVNEWARAMDSRKPTHVIFLDFSKAFDSVPHHRLLLKLERFGIVGKLLSWINSF